MPADEALGEEELGLLGDTARRARLRRALDKLRDHWGIAVLDTPPALGGLNDAALRAGDAVLVPAAADYLAAEALRGTLDAMRRVEKASGNRYAPLAILPTFVDRRRSGALAAEGLLRERFADLVLESSIPSPPASTRPRWPACRSSSRRRARRPRMAYRSAARELLGRLGERTPPSARP